MKNNKHISDNISLVCPVCKHSLFVRNNKSINKEKQGLVCITCKVTYPYNELGIPNLIPKNMSNGLQYKITLENVALNELESLAAALSVATLGRIVLFNGEVGAGKTTLINLILKNWGIESDSPTFAIINEHHLQNGHIIYHSDLYRIESIDELYNTGLVDIIQSHRDINNNDTTIFIEWADKLNISDLLNVPPIIITITKNELTQNDCRDIMIYN